MKKNIVILVGSTFIFISAFGFGAPDLATSEVRQKTYTETTSKKAGDAYKKAIAWFAKSFANSKEAIRLSDEKESKIIAKGNTACDVLKLGSGYGKGQKIEFTLTFQAKDKKIRLVFEDVVNTDEGSFDSGTRPSNKGEMDKVVTSCLDPLKSELLKAINETADDKW